MWNFMIGTALLRVFFGDGVKKESLQKCVGLISFVLIALFATAMGYYLSHDTEARLARLATEAMVGRAVVIDKHETWRNNNTYYDLTLEHITSDNVRHRANHGTEKARYEAARVGGTVPITYLRTDPDTFYLHGDEPTAGDLSMERMLFRGGLICLALTLGLFVWQWPRGAGDGGAPTSRAPSQMPMAPAAVSRVARSDGPPAFGKRR